MRSTRRERVNALAILGVVAALVSLGTSASAGLQETFDRGNEAFWTGEFEQASEAYEELIELGVRDVDVFYNLGTSYARGGRLGKAVLNFERALALDPGHTEAEENLRMVREAMARRRTAAGEDADLTPPRSFWMNLIARVTSAQVVIPFLVCWVGLFLVLGGRRLIRSEVARLTLMILSMIFGAGSAGFGALVVSKVIYDGQVQEAIAVEEDGATLREGPGGRFSRVVSVREGERLRVLDREGDWLHMREASGREGWGQTEEFGEIRLDIE